MPAPKQTKQPTRQPPAKPTPKQTTRQPPARPAPKQTTRQPPARPTPRKPPAAKPAPRADFGKPITSFLAKQPPALRAILDALRAEIAEVAPEATSSLKWGMPWFAIDGAMFCALGAHKTHVNLILPGPPGTYADPGGRLEGEGKTGKHLKLTSVAEIPRDAVRTWLKTAVARARS